MKRSAVALASAAALLAATVAAPPVGAEPRTTPKTPTSTGYDGAVSTVDPEASRIALDVLKKGGNATDAAVAAAAALGVTEPYSAGIGGGGYFVHYDAATGQVLVSPALDQRAVGGVLHGVDLALLVQAVDQVSPLVGQQRGELDAGTG